MENKVTIYTEGTGWVEIDLSSFYKTRIAGPMDFLDVWNFKSPDSSSFYAIKRVDIQIIKGSEENIYKLENKKYGKRV